MTKILDTGLIKHQTFNFFMAEKKNKSLISRPPVVVFLGHVDHGKTALLDWIRKTHLVEKESGGITQHIGAYQIVLPGGEQEKDGKKITFIDTPGHEAFSAMRARGASVADIAILVVAADEGVKPQTKEAILHIKQAGIPVIVAINKIDKPEANAEKTKRELSEGDILVESMGGKIPDVLVSAKTGKGIPDLLELILLVAEMGNLKANISQPAEGVIIESYMDKQRGPTATLLIKEGVLKLNDIIGTHSAFGKVKKLENFQMNSVEEALPSDPVVVIGFEEVPKLGEKFKVFPDLENAQKYLEVSKKKEVSRVLEIEPSQRVLNLILKTDVLGSIEAIERVLKELPQEKVVLRILKAEVGEINETDIKLAKSGRALILGFRTKINPIAKALAERENIKRMSFDIIYDLVEGVRKFMEAIMKSETVRINLGKVKISVIFLTQKNRQIIGGKVIEGEIKKGTQVEIFRNEELIGRGKMVGLQKNKKDVEKVAKGQECGMLFEGSVRIEAGDILTIYVEEKRKGQI
jgi:translation initiation factor IF-2